MFTMPLVLDGPVPPSGRKDIVCRSLSASSMMITASFWHVESRQLSRLNTNMPFSVSSLSFLKMRTFLPDS